MKTAGIFIQNTKECNHYLKTVVKGLPAQEGFIYYPLVLSIHVYKHTQI